jgi:hypothetical protein
LFAGPFVQKERKKVYFIVHSDGDVSPVKLGICDIDFSVLHHYHGFISLNFIDAKWMKFKPLFARSFNKNWW